MKGRPFMAPDAALSSGKTAPARSRRTSNRKQIAHHAERRFAQEGWTVPEAERQLDDGIGYLRSRLSDMDGIIVHYERFSTNDEAIRQVAGKKKAQTKLRYFHQLWYSGLTPGVGAAVALTRYVMAERDLRRMVEEAMLRAAQGLPADMMPLPPLPTGGRSAIFERVLDLHHSARRVQLRDADWKSRTRRGESIEDAVILEASLDGRDPYDRAGATCVKDAFVFLDAAGQRRADAQIRIPDEPDSDLTCFHMDVVPERRLAL